MAWFATQGFAVENTPAAKKHTSASSTAKRSSKATAKPKRTAAKTTSKSVVKASQRRTSKSSKKPAPAVSRRSSQQQPTPGRYKEIQQALVDKGYFAGSPDGNWGPESVDALKRFQRDQNLTEDGKIGSLSLIALGLGPQRVAAAASPTPVQ